MDGGPSAPLDDKFYEAQRAIVLTPKGPAFALGGCWATPKACIDAAQEKAGLKAQVARLEESAVTDIGSLVWAIVGVSAAVGLAAGILVGYLAWH